MFCYITNCLQRRYLVSLTLLLGSADVFKSCELVAANTPVEECKEYCIEVLDISWTGCNNLDAGANGLETYQELSPHHIGRGPARDKLPRLQMKLKRDGALPNDTFRRR